MDLEQLTSDLRAVCPIDGVNVRGNAKAGIAIVFAAAATAQQRTAAQAVLDAFDVDKSPVTRLPLGVLQARLEAEGAWDTYVNFMFGAPARRNAFLRLLLLGRPIRVDDGPFVTSLQGAGLTADQIARVTAPLP